MGYFTANFSGGSSTVVAGVASIKPTNNPGAMRSQHLAFGQEHKFRVLTPQVLPSPLLGGGPITTGLSKQQQLLQKKTSNSGSSTSDDYEYYYTYEDEPADQHERDIIGRK